VIIRLQLLTMILALLTSGCDIYPFRDTKSSTKKSISLSNVPKDFAILGPLSDANVTFYDYDSNAVIYATKTITFKNVKIFNLFFILL